MDLNAFESDIESWDLKTVAYIKKVYATYSSHPDFVDNMLTLVHEKSKHYRQITWLIKHHFDCGNYLDEKHYQSIIDLSGKLNHWESKLHLLQILPNLNLKNVDLFDLETFIRKCLQDKNKFVRAWAFQGFYELTKYLSTHKKELKGLCEMAFHLEESPSVKVKVRKIYNSLPKS